MYSIKDILEATNQILNKPSSDNTTLKHDVPRIKLTDSEKYQFQQAIKTIVQNSIKDSFHSIMKE
jgi:hypothetical protein